jgi:hypothetical protein
LNELVQGPLNFFFFSRLAVEILIKFWSAIVEKWCIFEVMLQELQILMDINWQIFPKKCGELLSISRSLIWQHKMWEELNLWLNSFIIVW